MQRDPIAAVRLDILSPQHFADWRDRRLETVSNASVRREWNILPSAMNIAVREWEWISKNPLPKVTKPPPTKARERLITQDEIDQVLYAAGDNYDNLISRAGLAFLFAIETGMRAGEIAGLRKVDIDLSQRVAHLPETKNGTYKKHPSVH